LPCADGFTPGPQVAATIEVENTPFNRGMHTAAGLFPDAASRQSFMRRAVVLMDITRDKKYRKDRDDDAGSMHIALTSTVAMVRAASGQRRRRCGPHSTSRSGRS
jgi:hypothetical protein